jgi:hypothetical protein
MKLKIEEYLKTYVSKGFYVVPELDKKPIIKDWPKSRLTLEDAKELWKDKDYNIGILTGSYGKGHFFVIDLDVKGDHDGIAEWNKFAAGNNKLNLKTLTVETPSGGRHLYFKSPWEVRNGVLLPGVEVKGVGGKVTAPPSEDGKYKYLETNGFEMANAPEELLQLIDEKKSSRSKLSIPETIDDGNRNETLFKAACSLVRMSTEPVIIEKVIYALNQTATKDPLANDEVNAIIQSALKYRKDEDREEAEKLAKLASLFEDLIKVSVGGKVVAYNAKSGDMWDRINGAMKYSNTCYRKKVKVGKKEMSYTINPFEEWFDDEECYEGLVFDPSGKENPGYYNTFKGWPYQAQQKGTCDTFLHHIKHNICQDKDELYDYLMDWCAQIVQEPTKKPGVAVAIRGASGTGKTTFAKVFGRLLGDTFIELSSIEPLVETFNSMLFNKVLVYADEAIWGGQKKSESRLKNIITSVDEWITYKGKESFHATNYKRLLLTTNDDWVAPVPKDDRRYFVLDIGNDNKQDTEFFAKIWKEMKNSGFETFMHILLNRDFSKRRWQEIPMTEAKSEQIERGLDSFDRWVEESKIFQDEDDFINKLYIHSGETVKVKELYERYFDWCKRNDLRYVESVVGFGKLMGHRLGITSQVVKSGLKSLRTYSVPVL